jgi:carbon storage regulator
MLVLSRRLGEQIVIGGEIRITVVAVQGNKVRIGITAPPDIRVDREEISQRLQGRTCVRGPSMLAAKSPRGFDNLKNNLPDPRRVLPLRAI